MRTEELILKTLHTKYIYLFPMIFITKTNCILKQNLPGFLCSGNILCFL
jgi:hypothetical protein